MHKFEWNYNIHNQRDFSHFVAEAKSEDGWLCNYLQLARLFYTDGAETILIELQVPTREMIDLTESPDEIPWLDAYAVSGMDDYDASHEIHTEIGMGVVLTYDNAEAEMLRLAKELRKGSDG